MVGLVRSIIGLDSNWHVLEDGVVVLCDHRLATSGTPWQSQKYVNFPLFIGYNVSIKLSMYGKGSPL